MDPLQVALTIGSALIGATSLLVASVALGARWEGRSESDRRLAEAKRREVEVSRHPDVVEAAVHEAYLEAFHSADTPVRKALEAARQLVSRAENQASFRKTRNKAHHEKLGDFERNVDEFLRLNQPRGLRGALRRARHGATRPFRREGMPGPTREPGRRMRT